MRIYYVEKLEISLHFWHAKTHCGIIIWTCRRYSGAEYEALSILIVTFRTVPFDGRWSVDFILSQYVYADNIYLNRKQCGNVIIYILNIYKYSSDTYNIYNQWYKEVLVITWKDDVLWWPITWFQLPCVFSTLFGRFSK